ncbi:MAG: AAA family ATPase [Staphylothermus sp.]|nr:AAA family ATPase [Staphylothermus sp.]
MKTWKLVKKVEETNRNLDDYFKMTDSDKKTFTINDIVKSIVRAFKENDHISILISGKRGAGKTTLMTHILANIYNDNGIPSFNKALDYTFFDPVEALNFIIDRLKERKPIICIGFDDAGTWISKWFISKSKAYFLQFTNLFRMVLGGSIYTDPGSIHKYIKQLADLKIHVRKLNDKEYNEFINTIKEVDPDYADYLITNNIRISEAKVYSISIDVLDRVWIRKKSVMYYPLVLPQSFRDKYEEKRRAYTLDLAIKLVEILLLENEIEILEKKKEALGKKLEKLKKLEERELRKHKSLLKVIKK